MEIENFENKGVNYTRPLNPFGTKKLDVVAEVQKPWDFIKKLESLSLPLTECEILLKTTKLSREV